MATNRNIVDLVKAIRNGIGGSAGGVDGIYMAKVSSVEPLTIQMHNVSITKNIFINPALILEASDRGDKMGNVFQYPAETSETYQFLKEFHEKYVLKKGDTVIVCVDGATFYIAGKAVRT